MKLTLDALNVIDAIDRHGSFAAAAEKLFRVPSAISYTMQKLEQDLDTPIFDRAGHRAVLTPAGQTLLKEGRRLLSAAHELEGQIKRIATGWEAELRIAIDTIIPVPRLLPLVQDFFEQQQTSQQSGRGTQLQLTHEVLGGNWDALNSNRADLVIGASGEGLTGGGYSSLPLDNFNIVFAVAPQHPLAQAEEPISSHEILKYRAVAVADSSQKLPRRSIGLLDGQQVLTVPNMQCKLEAQMLGLGVGYLPHYWVKEAVANGKLMIKSVQGINHSIRTYAVWSSDNQGKALQWFVQQLKDKSTQEQLFQGR
ncbi:MAG: LysR family transcriptional regulator [Ectothiorhodospiraceae bacterium]|nr:LysR family transcriptional regulator [Ectothiorhodospiraceae bacterium]